MLYRICYILAFGLLLMACTKVSQNAGSIKTVNSPARALSLYQAQNLHKSYGNVSEVLKSLEVLPTRERIRFTDTKAEFVHELIWAFDMVMDKTKGVYEVENLRPLYVLVPGDSPFSDPPAQNVRTVDVAISDEEPLYMRAFRSLGIQHPVGDPDGVMYQSAIIGAAVAEKEPKGDIRTQQVISVYCSGGSLSGKSVTTSDVQEANNFMWACIGGGGCAKKCSNLVYMLSAAVLDRYKISSQELPRFMEMIEKANSLPAEEQNRYLQEEKQAETLPIFEVVRRAILMRDAQYSQSKSDQAVSVE